MPSAYSVIRDEKADVVSMYHISEQDRDAYAHWEEPAARAILTMPLNR